MRFLGFLFSLVSAGSMLMFTASAQTVTVVFFRLPAPLKPLDGRLLLLLSNDPSDEPRMQIDDTLKSQMVFGVTVDGWKPGEPVVVGDNAKGYPRASLKDVPLGDYTIQAVLNVYETFHRSDGKIIKLAPDRGEGQHWNLAPGNLLSQPRLQFRIGPGALPVTVSLDQVIPPIEPEADTKYIRHIRLQSTLLTQFWGRPVYLAAIVLRAGRLRHSYGGPLSAITDFPHDHFVTGFGDFRETHARSEPQARLFGALSPTAGVIITAYNRRRRTKTIRLGLLRARRAY